MATAPPHADEEAGSFFCKIDASIRSSKPILFARASLQIFLPAWRTRGGQGAHLYEFAPTWQRFVPWDNILEGFVWNCTHQTRFCTNGAITSYSILFIVWLPSMHANLLVLTLYGRTSKRLNVLGLSERQNVLESCLALSCHTHRSLKLRENYFTKFKK
jgi:hypothetical protein